MEIRSKNSYQTYVNDFLKFDIPVCCPKCSKQAIVKPGNYSENEKNDKHDMKVICLACGYSKRLSEKPVSELKTYSIKTIKVRYFVIGGTVDPFFHLPLWFKTDCDGNELWAYNVEHIDFLISHVDAKLRDRNGVEMSNKSLGSRLPKWMTSKKNREIVLKELKSLRIKKEN